MLVPTSSAIRRACLAGLITFSFGSFARAAILLNDSFADGNRTSTNLPSDSPVFIGQTSGNGSNSTTTGAINFTLPTNSLKMWTYFTSNQSAPDGNQPHNSVTHLNVGDVLSTSMSFRVPAFVATASTSRIFRVGTFFDPTDARVQVDVNSDGGGGTAPWTDATGYVVQIPVNSAGSGSTPLQIGKRTTSNASLAGSGGAFTFASPNGGAAYTLSADTVYTLKLQMNLISASQLDVTASLLDGTTVLSTFTASDLGTSFGGTAIGPGLLPGSQSPYLDFDQIFWRNSDNTQATALDITNLNVELVPEPSAAALLGFAGLALLRRRQ